MIANHLTLLLTTIYATEQLTRGQENVETLTRLGHNYEQIVAVGNFDAATKFRTASRALKDMTLMKKSIDLHKTADAFKNELDTLIAKNIERLTKLVSKLESVAKSFSFDFKGDVQLKLDENDLAKIENEEDRTGVHFPIEHIARNLLTAYADSAVKRDFAWTGSPSVTTQMKMKRDGYDFFRQYVATETGITRIYPARPWLKSKHRAWMIDLFDPRFRPWYVSAVTAPKDVLFLLDFSGGVTGQTLRLIKMTVLSVLSLLTPNDYINAVWYNKDVGRVMNDCLNEVKQSSGDDIGFIPATTRNKILLQRYLNDILPTDVSHFSEAFNFSLNEMFRQENDKLTAKNYRSGGHQVVLLMTDMIEGMAPEFLRGKNAEDSNNTSMSVRVFGYNVGYGAEFIDPLHELACSNKGYYTMVNSLSDVRHMSRQFIPVLSRPLALELQNKEAHKRPVSFTGPYMDSQGEGAMLTLSMPVLNKMNNGSLQEFLGVAAIDIKLNGLITKLLGTEELGLSTYAFIADNNGYLLNHPKQILPEPDFQAIRRTACVDVSVPMTSSNNPKVMYGPSTEHTTQQMGYMDSIFVMDILEIEGNQLYVQKLRQAMVDRKCVGNVEFNDTNRIITCRNLDHFQLTIAIVMEKGAKEIKFASNSNYIWPEDIELDLVQTVMPTRRLCNDKLDLTSFITDQRFLNRLLQSNALNKCNASDPLTQRILAEIKCLQNWATRFGSITETENSVNTTIEKCSTRVRSSPFPARNIIASHRAAFIQSATGATHVFTNCTRVNLPMSLTSDIQYSTDLKMYHGASLEQKKEFNNAVYFRPEGRQVIGTRPIYDEDDEDYHIAAVIGAVFPLSDFRLNISSALHQFCHNVNESNKRCYVVTKQMFVLASGGPYANIPTLHAATHLSHIDPDLFDAMANNDYLFERSWINYQDTCSATDLFGAPSQALKEVKAANNLRPNVLFVPKALSSIVTGLMHALWHQLLPTLSLVGSSMGRSPNINHPPPPGRGPNGTCPYAIRGSANDESCIKEHFEWTYTKGAAPLYFNWSSKSYCDKSPKFRDAHVVPLNHSNLMLIYVNNPCPRTRKGGRRLYNRISECSYLRIRHRQRPNNTIYKLFHPLEDDSHCTAVTQKLSVTVFVLSLVLYVATTAMS